MSISLHMIAATEVVGACGSPSIVVGTGPDGRGSGSSFEQVC